MYLTDKVGDKSVEFSIMGMETLFEDAKRDTVIYDIKPCKYFQQHESSEAMRVGNPGFSGIRVVCLFKREKPGFLDVGEPGFSSLSTSKFTH